MSTARSNEDAPSTLAAPLLREGDQIGGYRVGRRLGRGGQSEVHEAEHVTTGRRAAIKVLLFKHQLNAQMRERAEAEADIEKALKHPNIVKVIEAGIDEQRKLFYTVMELLEGESLEERLLRKRRLELEEALWIISEALDGLSALHRRKVVHRDVKPDNILLTNDGRVVLIDLGIAKIKLEGDISAIRTDANIILGTFAYISPEQLERKPLDGRADLYSLGFVLWRCLAGFHPAYNPRERPEPPDATEYVGYHLGTAPPLISDVRPEIPANVAGLVRRMMEKDRDRRPRSAVECAALIDDLLEWLQQNPLPVRPAAPPARAAKHAGIPSSELWKAPGEATTQEDDSEGPSPEAPSHARFHTSAQVELIAPPPPPPEHKTVAGTTIMDASRVLPSPRATRPPPPSAPPLPELTTRTTTGTDIIDASAVLPPGRAAATTHTQPTRTTTAPLAAHIQPPAATPLPPPATPSAEPPAPLTVAAPPPNAARTTSAQAMAVKPPRRPRSRTAARAALLSILAGLLVGLTILHILRSPSTQPTAAPQASTAPDAGPTAAGTRAPDAAPQVESPKQIDAGDAGIPGAATADAGAADVADAGVADAGATHATSPGPSVPSAKPAASPSSRPKAPWRPPKDDCPPGLYCEP